MLSATGSQWIAALVLTLLAPGVPLFVSGRYSAWTSTTSPALFFTTPVARIT